MTKLYTVTTSPQLILNLYSLYIKAFRLYVISLLAVSIFTITQTANSVYFTESGYHLAVFEVEFYCLLLIVYNFRPSRFRKVILRSYNEDPSPSFTRNGFFWMIYLITLLIIFGVPLLICFGYIVTILRLINQSNQFILTHTSAWIPAILFLVISLFKLRLDIKTVVADAKFSVARLLYVLIVSGVITAVLYFLLLICRFNPNLLVIACLAFNLALFWTDFKINQKTRAAQ